MKVLQLISPTGFYGAERWVHALAENLDPDRVRCDLAITSEDPERRFEILDQYPPGAGATHRIEMQSRFDHRCIGELVQLIRREQIDVLHTHGYKSDLIGLLAARRAGIIAVTTPHGFGHKIDAKLRLFIRIGAFALRYFDAVAPLSPQLTDEVRAFGVPEARIRPILNGVNLREIDRQRANASADRAAESPGGSESSVEPSDIDDVAVEPSEALATSGTSTRHRRRIGFVGQMIPRKEIRELLYTFDTLWQRDDTIELQLVGDGPERAALVAEARTLKSAEAIEFTGFRDDRLELMSRMDLFVMTSSSEGIPRCLMEAMGLGIPVAAYDIPGIDQLLTHQETGLLAAFGDRETLAGHIRNLLDDPEQRDTLARGARERIEVRFSAQRMADEYCALFEALLAARHADHGRPPVRMPADDRLES